ncbi:septum site-determining protein MinC [Numidum massiliense]|uniref:septum site-determining protein MinC n=1 Tax=Numidum massiliense TaxID=1522315 RepID=UPI0006D5AF1A|nr:septum site-determining protein MinC [Numidum massiliense]
MEQVTRSPVVIKGTLDGLFFRLDDQCAFTDVLADLEQKLAEEQGQLLDGPDTSVRIQLGQRQIVREEERALRASFAKRPNLIITHISSEAGHYRLDHDPFKLLKKASGRVRAGQVLETDSSLLLFGDVNPGGIVRAAGHIYIFGSLRGTVHAGCSGQGSAIIVAAAMMPTQLRIATAFSRPPDEGKRHVGSMEFAYINGKHIAIEPVVHLHRVRPELVQETVTAVKLNDQFA